MPEGQLELEHAVGPLSNVGQALDQARSGVGVQELVERPTQQVLVAVPEDPAHGLADVDDHAVGADQDDDLGAVLDQGVEALLAGPQLGGPLDDPRLQAPGQRRVLEQGEERTCRPIRASMMKERVQPANGPRVPCRSCPTVLTTSASATAI